MRKSRSKKRVVSFSPGFDHWLRHLEKIEAFILGKSKKPPPDMSIRSDFFPVEPGSGIDTAKGLIEWFGAEGTLAPNLRSSMKFRTHALDLEAIRKTSLSTEMNPPFPDTFVEIIMDPRPENVSSMMYLLEERIADRSVGANLNYVAMGINPGDKFLCVNFSTYNERGTLINDERQADKISHFPIELHIPLPQFIERDAKGFADLSILPAPLSGVSPEPFLSSDTYQTIVEMMIMFLAGLKSIHTIVRTVSGAKPEVKKIKTKRPKYAERKFYEHHVLELKDHEMLMGTGSLPYTPRRLHPVRGFVRHYAKPLKSGPNKGRNWTWVKAQWRGDKDLGVITRDYDLKIGSDDTNKSA